MCQLLRKDSAPWSWLVGRSVGWLVGWLVGWSAGRLVGWLGGWLAGIHPPNIPLPLVAVVMVLFSAFDAACYGHKLYGSAEVSHVIQ